MDMAIHPGLGHRCGIGPNIARITVRKIQHEEVRLLLDTADPDQGFTEVGLSVAAVNPHALPAVAKGKTGRLLRRPQQHHAAASVDQFPTAVLS